MLIVTFYHCTTISKCTTLIRYGEIVSISIKKEKKTANIRFINSAAAQKAGEKREQAMNGSLIKVTYTSANNQVEMEGQKKEEKGKDPAKDQVAKEATSNIDRLKLMGKSTERIQMLLKYLNENKDKLSAEEKQKCMDEILEIRKYLSNFKVDKNSKHEVRLKITSNECKNYNSLFNSLKKFGKIMNLKMVSSDEALVEFEKEAFKQKLLQTNIVGFEIISK